MTSSKIHKHKFRLIVVYYFYYCVYACWLGKADFILYDGNSRNSDSQWFPQKYKHTEKRKAKMPKSIVLVMWKHGIYTIRTYKFVFVRLSML